MTEEMVELERRIGLIKALLTLAQEQARDIVTHARACCDFEMHTELEDRIEDTMIKYRKKVPQPMREYVPGEDMTGITVGEGETLEKGGMIACDAVDPTNMWYVNKDFFLANYEEVF